MKFSEIYKRAIEYWPEEIAIDDGYPTGPTGFRFPTLTRIWDGIEDAVDSDDQWTGRAVWCMYQAFHSESRQLHQTGHRVLKPYKVPKSEVETRLSENLKVEGWKEHLAVYENDLGVS